MLLLVRMRVLLLSLAAVFLCGLLLVGAKKWGDSIPYAPYDHEFLKGERPVLSVHARSLDDAREIVGHWPQAVLWVEVADADENARFPLVESLLREFPRQKFILNVANQAEIDHRLVKVLQPFEPERRVLIQSDADVVIKAVKTGNPLWVYGTSWSDLTKLMSFESVGLLSLAGFNGDVFIAPLKIMDRPAFNAAILTEMRRRFRPVFLGPLRNPGEMEEAKAFSPDGYVFDHKTLMQFWTP